MIHRLRFLLMLVALIFICFSFEFAQDDLTKKAIQHIEQSEKRKQARAAEEGKLQYGIYDLVRDAEAADTSVAIKNRYMFRLKKDKSLMADAKERVKVLIDLTSINDANTVVAAIQSQDGVIEEVGKDIPFIICKIHPKKLRQLAASSLIVRIQPVVEGHARNVVSLGDDQLKADSVRLQLYAYGDLVNIGVMSNGVDNWNDAKNSFELPDTSGKILKAGSGNEGTAMLEIVHDLAPNASLYFYTANGGYVSFAQGIRSLKAKGCKIIVDDFGWPNEPYFTDEDTALGATIRDFINGGGVFVSAAGNDNCSPSNGQAGYDMFSGTMNLSADNLNVFPTTNLTYLDCWVNGGDDQEIYFQWATSWNHPASDYDLYVYDDNGTCMDSSQTPQTYNGIYPPLEMIKISNSSSSSQHYRIRIKYAGGSQSSVDFKIMEGYPGSGMLSNSYTDNRHTYGHPGYPNVIGVAAYNAVAGTGYGNANQMAAYSSGGPLTMYSTASNSWATQYTPVITATSGVATWVGNNPAGNPYWSDGHPLFNGTSASAPHIAAIAGLYFSKYSTRTRDNFIADLKSSAVSINGAGGNGAWDSRAGYGKANALACLKLVEGTIATPSISPVSGTFYDSVEVTISTTTSGAQIRYTLDGSSPNSTSSPIYSSKFKVFPSCTINAVAFLQGNGSNMATVNYLLGVSQAAFISFTSPFDIYLPTGQTTVTATITCTNTLKYPNGYVSGGFIEVYIDSIGIQRYIQPINQGSHSFSYPFNKGSHRVLLRQNEFKDINSTSEVTFWLYGTFNVSDSIAMVLDQRKIMDSTIIGTLGVWNGTSFNPRFLPPQTMKFKGLTYQAIHGDTNVYQGQKYNNWNNLNDVTNNHTFYVDGKTLKYSSQFVPITPATVQSQVDGVPLGATDFKDPWLVDSIDQSHGGALINRGMANAIFRSVNYNDSKPNLDTSTNYRGVFLNKLPPADTSHPPYYMVRAALTQPIGGFTGYFQGWDTSHATLAQVGTNPSGYDQKAVVFTGANATVTAKYKGHLLASTNTATSDSTGAHGNNQRRIANDPSGMQYAVYTSGGSIWFTSNLYNGWTSEVLLGTGKNPSIDVTINKWNSTTGVHVVWEQNLGNGNRKIIYRRSRNNGTTWEPPISTVQSLSNDATPVVFGNSFPVVVWRGSDSLCVCLNPPVHGPSNGLVNTKVCGTNATSQLPTGVEDWSFLFYTAPRAMYHLFYTDGNSIYYENFQLDTSTFDFIGNSYQNAPVVISAAGGTTGNTNPSCAIPLNAGVYDSVAVAWENVITHKIYLRATHPISGMNITWAGVQQITTNTNLSKPSVCFDMNTWYPLVLFQSGTNIGESVFDGTHWTSMSNLGSGTGPQLPIYYTATCSPTALWTTGSATPFVINVATLVTTGDEWYGTQTVQGDVTVDSGATLTISPGTNVLFANGAKLTVNGTLNAIGTSTDSIRFDKTGSSTWGGIQFTPGSSGSIKYCSISNATNAISLNGTSTPVIANNRIFNCSNYGIYCYSASPHLYQNKIYGASYGLRCDHYSSPILGTDSTTAGPGNNTIMQCSNGIYASSSSQPLIGNSSSGTAGYNSIYNNINQDLIAAGCGVVYAQNNWWNGTPKLVPLYTTIYYTPMLSSNPNPSVTSVSGSSFAALGSKTPTINASIIGTGTTASSGSDGLSDLLLSELNGNYDAAITGYVQKLKADTSSITKKYCLARLSDCYSKGAKKDFSTFLNNNIRTNLKATDELYAATLEVESIHFVQDGSYEKALENYKTLIKTFSKNDDVYKHALFNAGYLCDHQLKDAVSGKKYFAQLKAHFPDDELTANALQMHGLTKMLSDSQTVKQLANEASGTGLVGNYPNPFNPTTTITFSVGTYGHTSLRIYDVLGREIATLVDGMKEPGAYNATFDGSKLASGMYFARFIVNPTGGKQIVQVKKMLMIK